MELFYGTYDGTCVRLSAEESGHLVRVLRHRAGDEIHVIDGAGTLLRCRLTVDDPRGAEAAVLEEIPGWGSHPYHLTVGCCPTKNADRFEWFVEKATELGVDEIVPLIGERSERRVFKTDRVLRVALAAAKQSLKARIPTIAAPVSVRDFLAGGVAAADGASPAGETAAAGVVAPAGETAAAGGELRLIAYCFEDAEHPRTGIREALEGFSGTRVTILIGPEGDFSPEEARLALAAGYRPIHLGPSRLRTETAAVTAAAAVYFRYI